MMNENLIISIKKELKNSEKTGNYDNLVQFAYANDLSVRFLFMNILISHSEISLQEFYEDDISRYFNTYDEEDNIINTMPYDYVKRIADSILRKRKDLTSYQKIISFIINSYFPKPEEFISNTLK